MDRADVGDHRAPRARRSPPARRSARRRASPSRAPGRRCPRAPRARVSGRPISVLRFSRLAWTWPGSSARAMSLTEVLPTEPVTPTTRAPSVAPPGAGERLQRGERVVDGEDPGARAQVVLPRWRTKSRPATVDDDAPGAGLDRRRGELAAVDALAAQAEEEVAGAGLAGVDRRPRRRSRPRPGRRSPRRSAAAICSGPQLQSRPQLLARDLAVVEGDLAAVLELLALLVALAGDHDGVAGPGPAQARARSRRGGRARPRPSWRRSRSRRGPRR